MRKSPIVALLERLDELDRQLTRIETYRAKQRKSFVGRVAEFLGETPAAVLQKFRQLASEEAPQCTLNWPR
jgi:hypothetical protein